MKFKILFVFLLNLALFGSAKIDNTAPEFTLKNEYDELISLSDFSGKTVILEWTNHECPFVKRHYETENMQSLQKEYTANDIVWLSIISSAPNKQGHVTNQESIRLTSDRNASPTHVLFDSDGKVGKKYNAKTTPHMYIIDSNKILRYDGAIDDLGMTGALFNTDLSLAKNYVRLAMNSIADNKEIVDKKTRPYGCSIKYP